MELFDLCFSRNFEVPEKQRHTAPLQPILHRIKFTGSRFVWCEIRELMGARAFINILGFDFISDCNARTVCDEKPESLRE